MCIFPMKTNFYVDGFNFYYGAGRPARHKWIDLSKLFRLYFPESQIGRIRYFTALVDASRSDPQKRQRQQTYIRALETIPNISVHYGYFQTNTKSVPLAYPSANGPRMVDARITEEKRTDVSLASYLLLDGFKKEYEQAVIVSNDADFITPIEIVRSELGLKVGLLHPQLDTRIQPSQALRKSVNFYRRIRKGALSASLFPDTLTDDNGTFRKPSRW